MENNLLSRILTGEANTEEKEEFYRKLGDSKAEEQLFYEVKSLWLRVSMQKNNVDIDSESEFNKLWARIKYPAKTNSFSIAKRIIQYAAIILIVLSIGGISGYYISKNTIKVADSGIQKYSALKGSVSIVEFADGTKVWLNANSHLTYQEDRNTKQRLAELTGEAYFEVKPNDDFPLLVKVGNIIVRDLGTTFNIKAYTGEKFIETSLVEGEADILSSEGASILTLKTGESAIYSSDRNTIDIKPITENVLSAWRDGKFVIRDQRLEDIFKELGRWYDIEFRFETQKFRDFRYTGNIKKTTTAQHVLKMLKLTTKINYRIIEKSSEPDVIIIY